MIELPDALQLQIDRTIAARVDSRLDQLGAAPRPRRGNWSAAVMNIGLVAFGFMTSGVTATYVHGPEAVIALAVEWTAIAAIGVTYTRAWAAGRHAAIDRGQALPLDQPQPPPAIPAAHRPTPIATAGVASDLLDRLPLDVRVKVEQILSKAELLLQHQDRFPIGSRHLQRENADRLVAKERFLEEHFGRPPQADPDLRLRQELLERVHPCVPGAVLPCTAGPPARVWMMPSSTL